MPGTSDFPQHGRMDVALIRIRVIQRKVQPAALLPQQRAVHDQARDRREIAQLEQIGRHLEVPVKLLDFLKQISQPRACTLEPFVRLNRAMYYKIQTKLKTNLFDIGGLFDQYRYTCDVN